MPIRMPGGLLRKPPLKCARTCPAWLAYPLGMLTQHGYVAPHWNYVSARPSVRVERSSTYVPTYVRPPTLCELLKGVAYCTSGSPYCTSEAAYCTSVAYSFLKESIRNGPKNLKKPQKSAIFLHFSQFFFIFLQFLHIFSHFSTKK